MDNIARVRLLTTFRTGSTSDIKLFEEGAELEAPFPRIIQKEMRLRPQFFEVLRYKSEENEIPIAPPVKEEPENPEQDEKPKLVLRG